VNNAITGRLWSLVIALASLRLTLLTLIGVALGVVIAYVSETRTVWALVLPLTACAINLLAAIASNPLFRRNSALLIFHLALLALIVLLALSRLTYLKGQAEVLEGSEFDSTGTTVEAGPWHRNHLDRVRFINEGFTIDYGPGLKRGATRNSVRYLADNGLSQRLVIGDMDPLAAHGYRFYTSPNKGFAPVFRWQAKGAAQPVTGAVHLPSYPINEYRQAQSWALPGSKLTAWVLLQLDQPAIDPEHADSFKIPANHRVILRIDERRWELRPGEAVDLPEGRLSYEGLRAWMGYTIFYDWTIPWLLAACLLAVGALGLHFWRKFAAKPWNE
jgi:cytochrome c biogenesis protein